MVYAILILVCDFTAKIMLLIFFLLKHSSACLDQTFHNTSVTIVGVRRPFTTIDGCFGPEKNLEKASLIQILNQSVPILYEDAYNNLDHLQDIVLENDGIREIRPHAFKNLPKIYSIKLKHNELREIRFGIFNNLSLTELSLVNNKIERIEPEAFDNLPNLSIILLGDNKLTNWDPQWFKGSLQITVLNFENNLIRAVPRRAFRNIQGVHLINNLNISTSIHLNNNKIQRLQENAFDGLETLGWLFLQRNEIEAFGEDALGNLQHLDWLRLDHNKLECVAEKVFQIAPNVKYYLEGNPLSQECIVKFNITSRNNGLHINKLNITMNTHVMN